jgi:ribosomal protein L18E
LNIAYTHGCLNTGPPLSLSRIAKLGEPEKGKKPKTIVIVGTVTDDVRYVTILT